MKKNFFKKLSFVMALAMIISVITPAGGVFAAAKPKLNSTSQYLFLNNAKTGKYDFNISNKQKGWKYAWTSSKTKVATVNKSNGLVTAKAAGTTTVSVVIKDSKGKKLYTLKATVTVRDNIKTLAISNAPTAPINAGEAYDFNRSYTTVAGKTTGTGSKTYWFITDKDGKATEGATIDKSGVFTATVPGDYKVTAKAFQSNTKAKAYLADPEANAKFVLATAAVDVKVVAQFASVAQKDIDTVEITFTAPMTDVEKNLTLYALIGTTEVKVTTVKKVSMSADKKVATVDLYSPFAEGTTYVVRYPDMKDAQFVSASCNFEDVVEAKITTATAVINTEKQVEVALLDKNGVNILTPSLKNRLYDWKSSSNKAVITDTGLLYMFNKGDETTVSVTFHGQKWDTNGNEIGNLTATANVVAVEADATNVTSLKAWTLAPTGTTAPNWKDLSQKIATSDGEKLLFVQLNTLTGSETGVISNTDPTIADKFKFESSDNTIAFMNGNVLYPVKTGSTTIVVRYNDKVVATIPLTIFGDRKATILELSAVSGVLSNSETANDSLDVTVTAKDQLGDKIAVSGLTAVPLSGSKSLDVSDKPDPSEAKQSIVTFKGSKAETGTYSYKITANDLSRYVTITVAKPTSATPTSYELFVSTRDADTKLSNDNPEPSISISLYGMAGAKTTGQLVGTTPNFVVRVTGPDSYKKDIAGTDFALYTVTNGAISKLKNGTYTVTAYEIKKVGANPNAEVAIDTDYFVVKDTQVNPTLDEIGDNHFNSDATIITDCFKVSLDGEDITNRVSLGDIIGKTTESSVFVKNLKYTTTFGSYSYTYTIDVNRQLYKNN